MNDNPLSKGFFRSLQSHTIRLTAASRICGSSSAWNVIKIINNQSLNDAINRLYGISRFINLPQTHQRLSLSFIMTNLISFSFQLFKQTLTNVQALPVKTTGLVWTGSTSILAPVRQMQSAPTVLLNVGLQDVLIPYVLWYQYLTFLVRSLSIESFSKFQINKPKNEKLANYQVVCIHCNT